MATFTDPARRFVDHINMCWFYRKKCQAIYTRSGADDVYNGFDSEAIYVQFLFTCEFCSESGQVKEEECGYGKCHRHGNQAENPGDPAG